MKKFIHICVLCIMILVSSTVFSGCWFGSGSSGGGESIPITDPRSGFPANTQGKIKPTVPGTDENDTASVVDSAFATYYADHTAGVRAVYVPDIDEISTDEILQADREKFLYNAAYQYEIIAKYILHCLAGNYGQGAEGGSLEYEFYADTSLLPTTDAQSTQIILPPLFIQEDESDRLRQSYKNAIDEPVVGIQYEFTTANNEYDPAPAVLQVRSTEFAWNYTGAKDSTENFINSNYQKLQVELMKAALTLQNIDLSEIEGYAEDKLDELIVFLAKKIDRLGILDTLDYFDAVKDIILNKVIGASVIAREAEEITYEDLVWERWEEIPVYGDEGKIVGREYGYVSHYYNISGNGDGVPLVSSEAYKYNYVNTVTSILEDVLGMYYEETDKLVDGFIEDFPTYSRVEIVDVNPFYYHLVQHETQEEDTQNTDSGEQTNESTILPIDYMDAQLYNSVIVFPKVPQIPEEYQEEYKDLTPHWQFDHMAVKIQSVADITMDVYVRIHKGNIDYVTQLTRMNTDSTQPYLYTYSWTDEDKEAFNALENDPEAQTRFYYSKKGNYLLTNIGVLGEDNSKMLKEGEIENTFDYQFYYPVVEEQEETDTPKTNDDTNTETEQISAYKNVFVGKLGSGVHYDNTTSLSAENFLDGQVDLSKLFVCTEEKDFVEFLFDVHKESETDSNDNYKFRFSVYPFFLNATSQTEQAETE